MSKFLALYLAPTAAMDEMMANSTPEGREAGMKEWTTWMQKNASVIADSAPLGKTKRVTASGVSSVRNEVGGYAIVEADSPEAAARIFEGNHPHFSLPGAYIDVMPIVPIPEK